MLLFDLAQAIQPPQAFVFGALAHNTGIDDEDVGIMRLIFGDSGMSHPFEFRRQPLGISRIHLATICPDMIFHKFTLIKLIVIYCSDLRENRQCSVGNAASGLA
jgi:hypothetical protein